MAKKDVEASWGVLRFWLRDASLQFCEAARPRVNALPAQATDPERVVPIIKTVLDAIDALAAGDERSPVLRALKRVFRPSAADKTRKKLTKSFDHYLKVWKKNAPA